MIGEPSAASTRGEAIVGPAVSVNSGARMGVLLVTGWTPLDCLLSYALAPRRPWRRRYHSARSSSRSPPIGRTGSTPPPVGPPAPPPTALGPSTPPRPGTFFT